MPPRIPILSGVRACNASTSSTSSASFSLPIRTFTSTPCNQASAAAQKRKHRDPYVLAQARARKAANLSRQAALKQERSAALGDPVRGITTPFVESFDTGIPLPSKTDNTTISKTTTAADPQKTPPGPYATREPRLKHFLTQKEINASLEKSNFLSAPLEDKTFDPAINPLAGESKIREHDEQHATASAAIARIVSLANGSSKDRTRVNVQRCIEAFGRHNTDRVLPPKARATANPLSSTAITAKTKPTAQSSASPTLNLQPRRRGGPDTGSSEVQIAVLTAKIRVLANFLETRGKTDKVNKRNLRLLVHRRQKLLQYLRKKERGGPRWQNVIETLGLTEGTWRGEISL